MPTKQKNWIALTGKSGVGKDTVASHLVHRHGYHRVAFADPIRAALLELDPIVSVDYVMDGKFETSYKRLSFLVDMNGWDHCKRHIPEVRRLLQVFGTESIRQLDADFWLNMAIAEADSIDGPVVFTDCRFPNEAQAIRDRGGLLVRIHRDVDPVQGHSSETALDKVTADFTIFSDAQPAEKAADMLANLHDLLIESRGPIGDE